MLCHSIRKSVVIVVQILLIMLYGKVNNRRPVGDCISFISLYIGNINFDFGKIRSISYNRRACYSVAVIAALCYSRSPAIGRIVSICEDIFYNDRICISLSVSRIQGSGCAIILHAVNFEHTKAVGLEERGRVISYHRDTCGELGLRILYLLLDLLLDLLLVCVLDGLFLGLAAFFIPVCCLCLVLFGRSGITGGGSQLVGSFHGVHGSGRSFLRYLRVVLGRCLEFADCTGNRDNGEILHRHARSDKRKLDVKITGGNLDSVAILVFKAKLEHAAESAVRQHCAIKVLVEDSIPDSIHLQYGVRRSPAPYFELDHAVRNGKSPVNVTVSVSLLRRSRRSVCGRAFIPPRERTGIFRRRDGCGLHCAFRHIVRDLLRDGRSGLHRLSGRDDARPAKAAEQDCHQQHADNTGKRTVVSC